MSLGWIDCIVSSNCVHSSYACCDNGKWKTECIFLANIMANESSLNLQKEYIKSFILPHFTEPFQISSQKIRVYPFPMEQIDMPLNKFDK